MKKFLIGFTIGFIIGGIGGYKFVKDKYTQFKDSKVTEEVISATNDYISNVKKAVN